MDIRPLLTALVRHKATALLLICEIAITFAIVSNGLFLVQRRFVSMSLPSGVATEQLLQIQLATTRKYDDARARLRADLATLRQLPDVTAASYANQVPLGLTSSYTGIGLSPTQRQPTLRATLYFGDDLLATLGTHLVAGRNLIADDFVDYDEMLRAEKPRNPSVIVITQAIAKRLWPAQTALGRTLYVGDVPFVVVGVIDHLLAPEIADVASAHLSVVLPIRPALSPSGSYLVRTAATRRTPTLQAAVAALKVGDPRRVVNVARSWKDLRDSYFQQDRVMLSILLVVCAALLLVTALGIVGLVSFWVAQRRHSIGIYRALGATRARIVAQFQTENMLLMLIGCVVGSVLAFGMSFLLMRHYALPRLPWLYPLATSCVMVLLGQIAALSPALRAAAIPPMVATRSV